MTPKRKKILLSATSGGHVSEILALFGEFTEFDIVVFTERTPRKSAIRFPVYDYKRPQGEFMTMLCAGLKALYIILKERPEWVITTGAECGTAAILTGKLLFRKTMFIETASRFRTKTVSAKICYPLVDKFYVQHEEALSIYGKKAEYIGGVL